MSNNSNTTFHIDSKFELVPGKSLGLFKLGDHLFNILNLLKYKPIVHRHLLRFIQSINQLNLILSFILKIIIQVWFLMVKIKV